uniref:N-acetyltransferase domain-containing protein n=1 Tax=Vertebrata lanosa TaxID=1261582 RepID=A0A0B5W3R8_9FLOR|nr:hypothetical protein [Vertebrata lanosa]AJH66055.1 hypothetical protein [Vertebrata lanosa]
MTFWKSFFNYKNSTTCNKKNEIKTKDILIKKIKKENREENIYFSKCKTVNLEKLEKLCDAVGWVRRPLKKVKFALENSFLTISMFCYEGKNERLIGFARVTSDGSFNATIWDVVIHPEFQGNGLGKLLMNEVIKELREYDISTITLFADPEVIKFYKNVGFIIDPDGVKGMFWYPV